MSARRRALPGGLPEPLLTPHPERLDPARPDAPAILAAHEAAVRAGHDAYLDPATCYQVFTAAYLWERGNCCEIGCRHCPWVDLASRLDERLGEDRLGDGPAA
ncbi:MAG: DUF5522 domain-containing protein [Actinomycetes bacterium]